MSGRLDRKLVKQLTGKPSTDFASVRILDASDQKLSEVGSLGYLPILKRLDLSRNQLRELGGVQGCTSLRQLNISGNQLTTLQTLSGLPGLQVLNVGQNQIAGKMKLSGLPSLAALIANDNAISGLKDLGELTALNTLVLKNNHISSLGSSLARCRGLAKLSMAHNQVTDLATSLEGCPQLAELRLSHNKLSGLPESLAHCPRLKIVDLGGNLVESLTDIKVLAELPYLNSLTLKGCPVAEAGGYQQMVQAMLPHLQTLDNKRLDNSVRRLRHATEVSAGKLTDKPKDEGPRAAQERGSEAQPLELEGASQDRSRFSWGIQPAKEDVGKVRAEADLKRARSDEYPPHDESEVGPMQKGGKKQKTKRRAETQAAPVPQEENDVEKEARAQDFSNLKKGRAAKKSEGTAAAPGGKHRRKVGASAENTGNAVRNKANLKASQDVEMAGIGTVEEKTLELKAGMRGAQVGAALQNVLGNLESERPLAPAWD